MAYTPRPSREILRDLCARMVARSTLTDLNEGSVLYDLLSTVAEQIAESDVRLAQIRDQFTLDGATGTDLDERAEELGMSRLSATRANGDVTLSRADTTDALAVPVGSVLGRSDSDVTYITTEEVSFSAGVASVDVRVQAQSVGAQGNASSSSIDLLIDMPSDVTGVTQAGNLSNGVDAETDSALRARARRHLNSLARCQPVALEYAVLSYTATDETRATVATVYEDPVTYGRVEILIDDGSGLGDDPSTRAGEVVSMVATSASAFVIGIERAVSSGPTVTRARFGLPTVNLIEGVDYRIDRGAGTVTILEGADVGLGDVVTVGAYRVYEGLINELQGLIEGAVGDVTSGYRPAGVAVRVLPAPVQRADMDILITAEDGANLTTVTSQARLACIEYLSTLGAGEPAYMARVVDAVLSVSGVINVKVYRPSTSTAQIDQSPSTPRHIIRAGQVRAVTSLTGA